MNLFSQEKLKPPEKYLRLKINDYIYDYKGFLFFPIIFNIKKDTTTSIKYPRKFQYRC